MCRFFFFFFSFSFFHFFLTATFVLAILALFEKKGTVKKKDRIDHSKRRWPEEVEDHVRKFAAAHPCFFLEELKEELLREFPNISNFSTPTICRALHYDLNLTRKFLTKQAREARKTEVMDDIFRLKPLYLYPEQLVFVDETSKDARASLRQHAWSLRGTPAIVSLPFARGKRVSALAAFNHSGFVAWGYTPDTFTRFTFHKTFVEKILPHLNKWPLPNSIVVIDNSRIHMYKEFQEAVQSRGAVLVFLPPYCPQFNPIETGFANLKHWIQRYAHLVFGQCSQRALDVAFECCISDQNTPINLMAHSGYDRSSLDESIIALHDNRK